MSPRANLLPVIVNGEVQLFDIYIDGKWIGSRRTEKQSLQAIDWALR